LEGRVESGEWGAAGGGGVGRGKVPCTNIFKVAPKGNDEGHCQRVLEIPEQSRHSVRFLTRTLPPTGRPDAVGDRKGFLTNPRPPRQVQTVDIFELNNLNPKEGRKNTGTKAAPSFLALD
jgi:hypothetical protein